VDTKGFEAEMTNKRKQEETSSSPTKKKKEEEKVDAIVVEEKKKKEKKKVVSDSEDESDNDLPLDELDEMQSSQAERQDRQKHVRKVSKCKFLFETSGLGEVEKDLLQQIVEKHKSIIGLACAPDYEYAGEKFTHLIAADDKRTLKVLFAIAHGADIIDSKWLFENFDSEELVPVEKFIRPKYKAKKNNLFKGLKFAVIGKTQPDHGLIKALIVASGGSIVKTVRGCHYVIVGEGAPKSCISSDHKTVREAWLFDSVAEETILNEGKYKVTKEDCEKWQPVLKKKKGKSDYVMEDVDGESEDGEEGEEEEKEKKPKEKKEKKKPKEKTEKKEKKEKKPKEKTDKKEKKSSEKSVGKDEKKPKEKKAESKKEKKSVEKSVEKSTSKKVIEESDQESQIDDYLK
jgi:hypothetical protein